MAADNGLEIMKLANDAAAQLKAISETPGANEADARAAFESFEDVLLLMGRHAIDSFEGRTALLTGLIAELSAFTKTIKVKNPILDRLKQITAIADKASGLFKKEKAAAKPA